jgi:hypothetical protein
MYRGVMLVALVASCGPVAYVQTVSMSADTAVEQARAADADKWSPYYWTRAIHYLHMAREVAAHADYQGANRFGRLATEAALKAKEEAEIGEQNPSRLPYIHLDLDHGVAPAKDKDKDKGDVAPAKDKNQVAPAKEEP